VKLKVSLVPRSTPLGRRATALGVGLLFAGANTGNNLFFLVFAVLAACELVGSLAAGRVLRRAEARLALPARGRAGTPLRVSLQIRNRASRLPLPALAWELEGPGGEKAVLRTPPLRAGEKGSGTAHLAPVRRGRFRIRGATARTDYPVGLARRVVRLPESEAETLVAPRLLKSRARSTGARRGDVRRLAHPKGVGEEPLDAREYRRGDDARRIDWKASARTERIMWRDRKGDPPRAIQVRLDRSGPAGPGFEARVSRAAGAASAALGRGDAVGFASDEWELLPRSGPAQRRRILDYLALVEPAGAAAAEARS
jgi:uncharacterized protein (DUF58 family)